MQTVRKDLDNLEVRKDPTGFLLENYIYKIKRDLKSLNICDPNTHLGRAFPKLIEVNLDWSL